jgi:putative phosphoesterase
LSIRIAIVSDIHGSLAALEAVRTDLKRQSPDLVLHGGDVAVNGPNPAEVVDEIRELGWPGVVGNTDEILWRPEQYVEQQARMPKLHPLLSVLFEATGPATAELLGAERIQWLRSLPRNWHNESLFLLHARPGDLWRAPTPTDSDEDLTNAYGGLGAPTVVYCHIHRPFVRTIGSLTIANAGSAGLPWDGDPRASYLLIDAQVSIRRIEYDVGRDIAELGTRKYPHAPWLGEMRRLGKFIQPF